MSIPIVKRSEPVSVNQSFLWETRLNDGQVWYIMPPLHLFPFHRRQLTFSLGFPSPPHPSSHKPQILWCDNNVYFLRILGRAKEKTLELDCERSANCSFLALCLRFENSHCLRRRRIDDLSPICWRIFPFPAFECDELGLVVYGGSYDHFHVAL